MKELQALLSDARLVVFQTWTGSTYFGAACGIAWHRHLKGGFKRSFIAILRQFEGKKECGKTKGRFEKAVLRCCATLHTRKFGRSAQLETKEEEKAKEEEKRTFCARIPFHASHTPSTLHDVQHSVDIRGPLYRKMRMDPTVREQKGHRKEGERREIDSLTRDDGTEGKGRLGIGADNGGTQVTAEGLRSVCGGVALPGAVQMVVVKGKGGNVPAVDRHGNDGWRWPERSTSGKCFSSGMSWRGLARLAHLALLGQSRQLMPESPPDLTFWNFIHTSSKPSLGSRFDTTTIFEGSDLAGKPLRC
ncbi:hypothetical protein B0H10DRAFT_1947838 [Mycena sp. CBHHK59/15]|nr:hypothetical protein B0H10DRAFT_1947838 [Mycena sp. CBHHK59/15]